MKTNYPGYGANTCFIRIRNANSSKVRFFGDIAKENVYPAHEIFTNLCTPAKVLFGIASYESVF